MAASRKTSKGKSSGGRVSTGNSSASQARRGSGRGGEPPATVVGRSMARGAATGTTGRPANEASGGSGDVLYVRTDQKAEFDRVAEDFKLSTSQLARDLIAFVVANPAEVRELLENWKRRIRPMDQLRDVVARSQEAEHAFAQSDHIRAVNSYEKLREEIVAASGDAAQARITGPQYFFIQYRLAYVWTRLAYQRFGELLEAGREDTATAQSLWRESIPLVLGCLSRADAEAQCFVDGESSRHQAAAHVQLAARYNLACGTCMRAQVLLETRLMTGEPDSNPIRADYMALLEARSDTSRSRCELVVRFWESDRVPEPLREEVLARLRASLAELEVLLGTLARRQTSDDAARRELEPEVASHWIAWSLDTDDDTLLLELHPETRVRFAAVRDRLRDQGLDSWIRDRIEQAGAMPASLEG